MNYNYHTHTYRCRHATSTPEEYILRAIGGGIKNMGFSDHAPFVFPDGHESGFRVPMAQAAEYVNELRVLREKYKDKIDIKIGFEMEYYPSHFEKMLSIARAAGGEYLILGQHFIGEEYPSGLYMFRATDREEHLCEYVDCVVAAMKSGYFSYVAHPDLGNYVGDEAVYDREMRRLCSASRELGIPLEINFLGIRTSRHYPCEKFWKIAGEERALVTFGFDAHDPDAACDRESLATAWDIVKRHSLYYIGKPEIIDIQ